MEQKIADGHGTARFAAMIGLSGWQVRLGREHGLLPDPDLDGERWSPELVEEAGAKAAHVIAAFGNDPPIGAARAADRLAVALGLDVERPDVEVLVTRGDLRVVSHYREYPVYLRRDVDALAPEAVAEVVAARKGPLNDTVDAKGAARILGWPRRAFDRIAAEREVTPDQLGRFRLSDIRALGANEQLAARILDERRRAAHAKALKEEIRIEDDVRGWLLRCTAYVDRDADEPPDLSAARRALRALSEARARTDATSSPH